MPFDKNSTWQTLELIKQHMRHEWLYRRVKKCIGGIGDEGESTKNIVNKGVNQRVQYDALVTHAQNGVPFISSCGGKCRFGLDFWHSDQASDHKIQTLQLYYHVCCS